MTLVPQGTVLPMEQVSIVKRAKFIVRTKRTIPNHDFNPVKDVWVVDGTHADICLVFCFEF